MVFSKNHRLTFFLAYLINTGRFGQSLIPKPGHV
jgi:hypothetical protein